MTPTFQNFRRASNFCWMFHYDFIIIYNIHFAICCRWWHHGATKIEKTLLSSIITIMWFSQICLDLPGKEKSQEKTPMSFRSKRAQKVSANNNIVHADVMMTIVTQDGRIPLTRLNSFSFRWIVAIDLRMSTWISYRFMRAPSDDILV